MSIFLTLFFKVDDMSANSLGGETWELSLVCGEPDTMRFHILTHFFSFLWLWICGNLVKMGCPSNNVNIFISIWVMRIFLIYRKRVHKRWNFVKKWRRGGQLKVWRAKFKKQKRESNAKKPGIHLLVCNFQLKIIILHHSFDLL